MNSLFMTVLSSMIFFSRTLQVVKILIHQVGLKGEEIQTPLTQDLVLYLGVVLDQTHQQRTTVRKQHQTMSPVTKSKVESLQPSEWTVALSAGLHYPLTVSLQRFHSSQMFVYSA